MFVTEEQEASGELDLVCHIPKPDYGEHRSGRLSKAELSKAEQGAVPGCARGRPCRRRRQVRAGPQRRCICDGRGVQAGARVPPLPPPPPHGGAVLHQPLPWLNAGQAAKDRSAARRRLCCTSCPTAVPVRLELRTPSLCQPAHCTASAAPRPVVTPRSPDGAASTAGGAVNGGFERAGGGAVAGDAGSRRRCICFCMQCRRGRAQRPSRRAAQLAPECTPCSQRGGQRHVQDVAAGPPCLVAPAFLHPQELGLEPRDTHHMHMGRLAAIKVHACMLMAGSCRSTDAEACLAPADEHMRGLQATSPRACNCGCRMPRHQLSQFLIQTAGGRRGCAQPCARCTCPRARIPAAAG